MGANYELPEPDVDGELKQLDDALRVTRRGPIKRFALYASGVDRKILRVVPAEEANYVVLGTFVLLAAALAGFGVFVSTGFWLYGRPHPTTSTVAAGVVGALFILALDRALVRAPLNAYQYPPEVLEALWNPAADSKWFAVLNDALTRPSAMRRARQAIGVIIAASFRVALSFCVSFLVAEVVLFVIFNTEVTARVQYLRQQSVSSAIQAENASYNTQVADLTTELDGLLAVNDPKVQSLDTQISTANNNLQNAHDDVSKLQSLEAKEIYGGKSCATLSTGIQICSSGLVGRGPEDTQLQNALATANAAVTKDQDALSTLNGERSAAYGAALTKQNQSGDRINSINQLLTADAAQHKKTLEDLNNSSTDTKGLLIRHQALNALENDAKPETVAPDPFPPCSGFVLARYACDLRRTVWPPTPMGAYVASFRLIFMIIDLMPIFFKLYLSMRRRRPYDAVRAALEERYQAAAINLLDERLVVVGEQLERRASRRKARRSGSGADFLLKARSWAKNKPKLSRADRERDKNSALADMLHSIRRGYEKDPADDPRLRPPDKFRS